MTAGQKLQKAWQKNNSLLCVGLDSDRKKLPEVLKKEQHPQFTFNKAIIDATHDFVCAYKPNTAFYESRGVDGIAELKMTCDYLKSTYPETLLIIDAKRGDIGNTNNGYAEFVFDYLRADGVTLHPYLGREALSPFLERADKWSIILCRTSNPGAGEFQDVQLNNELLYQHVARHVAESWDTNNNCMLVVGATYPEELAEVRKIVGDMPILVPGVGSQGGDLEKTLKNGLTPTGKGLIISISRAIIFASDGTDFAEKAADKARNYHKEIQAICKEG